MLQPYRVTRSVRHLETKGDKTLVSVAFNASFVGSYNKCLTIHSWVSNSLLGHPDNLDGSFKILGFLDTPLMRKDWSNEPTLKLDNGKREKRPNLSPFQAA